VNPEAEAEAERSLPSAAGISPPMALLVAGRVCAGGEESRRGRDGDDCSRLPRD
jgi:hypothetical protein